MLMPNVISIEAAQIIHSGEGGRLLSLDASFTHKYKYRRKEKNANC